MAEILSIACIRPEEGKEQETLEVLSELYSALQRKGYSRDLLYRDQHGRLINLRYWRSEEMRDAAHDDPEIHRLWHRLANVSEWEIIAEKLESIEGSWSAAAQ